MFGTCTFCSDILRMMCFLLRWFQLLTKMFDRECIGAEADVPFKICMHCVDVKIELIN